MIDEKELALKLNDHDHEINSAKHRIDELEEKQNSIEVLTLSTSKLATNMEHMLEEQKAQREMLKEQSTRLSTLEREPADNAKYYKRTILTATLTTIIGAVIGALIALLIK